MIELNKVTYSYDGECALKSIDLFIKKGEAVALIGPIGCGKTTLLKLLNGIILPERGAYKFNGEEISRKKLQDVKFSKLFHQKIGFVFQSPDTQLFCPSVREEIAFGPRQMGLPEPEVEKRVGDCLALLGIESLAGKAPYHLSGGEKKKTAIASVIALNPDVLILDEPMSGLDPKTQVWLSEFLRGFINAGKTLISATHNLALVPRISRRAVLIDGRHAVAADMPSDKLAEEPGLLLGANLISEADLPFLGKEFR
ncbi:MAG: ABC transporter ATP-binding protein [Bacillota bacterium]|nr:ABC transporter ATP-binding protein [Bacillota bacterium]